MVGKDNFLGQILEKWGVFLDFVTQYFAGIFSEPPKILFTNKLGNCSIFDKTTPKIIDIVYIYKK